MYQGRRTSVNEWKPTNGEKPKDCFDKTYIGGFLTLVHDIDVHVRYANGRELLMHMHKINWAETTHYRRYDD
jgi:hypothetical protein